LLALLCRHADTGDKLAAAINATDPGDKRYRALLEMAARQSAMVALLSQKLRLTPQNLYRSTTPLPKVQSGLKPWEKHGGSKWGFVS
jgi:hypothetical protein